MAEAWDAGSKERMDEVLGNEEFLEEARAFVVPGCSFQCIVVGLWVGLTAPNWLLGLAPVLGLRYLILRSSGQLHALPLTLALCGIPAALAAAYRIFA